MLFVCEQLCVNTTDWIFTNILLENGDVYLDNELTMNFWKSSESGSVYKNFFSNFYHWEIGKSLFVSHFK